MKKYTTHIKLEPYEERLVKEYIELYERTKKLSTILRNWGSLDFVPKCTYEQLRTQYKAMRLYRIAIEERNDFKILKPQINFLT